MAKQPPPIEAADDNDKRPQFRVRLEPEDVKRAEVLKKKKHPLLRGRSIPNSIETVFLVFLDEAEHWKPGSTSYFPKHFTDRGDAKDE